MAFRKHNPNVLGPLQSDETWKLNPSKGSSNNDRFAKGKSSNDDELLDIDKLIRQFDHITVANENRPAAATSNGQELNITKRLSNLHDYSKEQPEPIGGEILPLSATKKDIIVSPKRPKRDGSYSFQQSEPRDRASNDRLPSFRIHEPPAMKRITSGSSSFPMHVLRRNTHGGVSTTDQQAATKHSTNDRSAMNYSLATRQYLPEAKSKFIQVPFPDISQHQRKSSTHQEIVEQQAHDCARRIRQLTDKLTKKGAEAAELILRSMISSKVRPSGSSYNRVIHAYASLGMPSKAEKVLFLMFDDWQHGNTAAEPNVRIFTSVLKAWQRARTRESPKRCEKIIEAMEELSTDPRLANCKPDAYALTVLMHSYVDSPLTNVAPKIDRIFRSMKRKYAAGDLNMQPDCIVYSLVLNAHVREFSLKKAEAVLWEMVNDYLNGNFNTILAMYARSCQLHAPDRAEAIVAKFRDLCNTGKLSIKPDAYTYSQLLKTWVTSGRKDAIDKAVVCFYWMKKLGEEGDDAAAPDTVKYSTIICAYTNNGDYQQARSMLEVMAADHLNGNTRAVPDIMLYDRLVTCCLAAVGKRNIDPLKAADAIITELWCLAETVPKLRPTMKMYVSVIQKHIDMKNPMRAHTLLMDILVSRRRVVGNPAMSLCNSVLRAWEVSNHPSKKSYMFRIRVAMFEIKK